MPLSPLLDKTAFMATYFFSLASLNCFAFHFFINRELMCISSHHHSSSCRKSRSNRTTSICSPIDSPRNNSQVSRKESVISETA